MIDKFEHHDAGNYFCVEPYGGPYGEFWIDAGDSKEDSGTACVTGETLVGLYDWLGEALGKKRGHEITEMVLDETQWFVQNWNADSEPVKSAWTPEEWDSWYQETTTEPEGEDEFTEIGTMTLYLWIESRNGNPRVTVHEEKPDGPCGTIEVPLYAKIGETK